jgi:hypothetical protein
MEKVKQDHVPPGGQPGLVRDLALEAIRFVRTGTSSPSPRLPRISGGWR